MTQTAEQDGGNSLLRRKAIRCVALPLLNAALIAITVWRNVRFQGFCVPVPWAALVLGLCALHLVAMPCLCRGRIALINSALGGVSHFALLYYLLFMRGLGLICPVLLMVEVVYFCLVAPEPEKWRKRSRLLFAVVFGLCLLLTIPCGVSYRNACQRIEASRADNFTTLETNYMTERIVGMHFKYHTRFCLFDGWRPPLHDPAFVFGMWYNGYRDPLQDFTLAERIELYTRLFPDRDVVFPCAACSRQSRLNGYFTDPLWELKVEN